jgi:hypothetical protein
MGPVTGQSVDNSLTTAEHALAGSRMGTAPRLGFLRAADRPRVSKQGDRPIVGNRQRAVQPFP